MMKIICKAPVTPAVNKTPNRMAKVAERLNGRLAMQGVTWGTLNQFILHEGGVRNQLQDPHNLITIAAVTALVTAGTSFTQNEYEKSYFVWTPEVELLNGRVVMGAITVAGLLNL
tara:strand:- start:467 stop:811 length:345 start_codon:yes stop_codon:yes gene_type:complete